MEATRVSKRSRYAVVLFWQVVLSGVRFEAICSFVFSHTDNSLDLRLSLHARLHNPLPQGLGDIGNHHQKDMLSTLLGRATLIEDASLSS